MLLRFIPALAFALLAVACAKGQPARSVATSASVPSSGPVAAPVTWFSIPATDPEAAADFYRRAFRWKVEPTAREEDHRFDYNVVVSSPSDAEHKPEERGRVNGCIVKRSIGISTPVVLVEVQDLDQAARDVTAAGGTVVSAKIPMRSLNGEFILVRDPDGNMLEVFRSVPR